MKGMMLILNINIASSKDINSRNKNNSNDYNHGDHGYNIDTNSVRKCIKIKK